jgi:predicted nucleic acid-binding protein
MSLVQDARDRNGEVVTAASTLAEVVRGRRDDASVHRVLKRITVVPIDPAHGRAAGELLGRTGLSGSKYAVDALVAAVALRRARPAVLLTSDPKDMEALTDEPERPRAERIAIIAV